MQAHMTTAFEEFKRGLLDEMPLQIGIFPFGLVYGILGVESGMSILETCLLSVILFGGASQIVFAQLWPARPRQGSFWHRSAP